MAAVADKVKHSFWPTVERVVSFRQPSPVKDDYDDVKRHTDDIAERKRYLDYCVPLFQLVLLVVVAVVRLK